MSLIFLNKKGRLRFIIINYPWYVSLIHRWIVTPATDITGFYSWRLRIEGLLKDCEAVLGELQDFITLLLFLIGEIRTFLFIVYHDCTESLGVCLEILHHWVYLLINCYKIDLAYLSELCWNAYWFFLGIWDRMSGVSLV